MELTYQDLQKAVAKGDSAVGEFLKQAVAVFQQSDDYKNAVDGMAYYMKHNKTIERYQKFLYTISGNTVPDKFGANYKLKSLIFRRLITQQNQYVLGNGVTMNNKDKLGADFDYKLKEAGAMAMAQGRCFGFWNYDHLEVFSYADTNGKPGFVPLLDENTSDMMAGIRYWFRVVDGNTVFRATLYEQDGYSEWVSSKETKDRTILLTAKRGYIRELTENIAEDIETFSNYNRLPIVTLYASDTHESELVGLRESIDCYDIVKSGLANNIDDAAELYWVVKNAGGMDDLSLAQFVSRMKTVKAASLDDDQTAEAHTKEIPTAAREKMLEILSRDIYRDFGACDITTLSAAQKTAQEIQAAYQEQDNKCADYEYQLIEFIRAVLNIAGLPDEIPVFQWNKVINLAEQTNMVLSAANYLDERTVLEKLPFVLADEVDEILNRLSDEDVQRFTRGNQQEQQESNENDEETEETGDIPGGDE